MLVAGLLVVSRCGTQVLVGGFLFFDVFWCVVLEGGSKNNNGAADVLSRGVETTTSFEGGSKKQQRGCSFCL